ncbi:MAG: ROK family protein [Planctomycetaceae bacterium]|jgi:glucokinase|nr:ROK family protein [Planctomycetaceae bacterium]
MNILGLDIGGSKLIAALLFADDSRFEIYSAAYRSLASDCDREQLLTLIDDAVSELGNISFERIGVTIPGLADSQNGIWIYACFSGISDFPIAKILSERYGNKPIAIENDVNACALAEKKFGKCRELNDFLWVTVSNGIGGGLILGGEVYSGHFGGAGEIGHFGVVDFIDGCQPPIQCGCGHFGCLEAEAAGPGIAKRYAWKLQEQQRLNPTLRVPILPSYTAQTYTAQRVAELASGGDEIALSVMETTGTLLGKAASYAVNLLNLEAVIFGGGVMQSFDLLFPSLEKSFRSHLFRSANSSVKLEQTGLGYHAGLAGAAALALFRKNCL